MDEKKLKNFWSKVIIPKDLNQCWNWNAAINEAGYGIFGVNGKKVDRAHRISWRLHNGEIPDGIFVCHTCDNRKCINPAHLFLGSNTDNVRDMISKKRNAPIPNMGGWNRYSYSSEIIDLLGKEPDTKIAKKANVTKYAIANERKRRGIAPFPCQTKFTKGSPHPRWGRKGVKDGSADD